MNWYLETGKETDVVKSTRIRFLRNIKGFKFKLNPLEQEELENRIRENLYSIGYGLKFLKLKDMDNITKTPLIFILYHIKNKKCLLTIILAYLKSRISPTISPFILVHSP